MQERRDERDFDLAIVGASFAGLVAARTAAMRGLRVAVIEKKREPGAAVHTTGILVKEAAEALDVPAELTRRIHGVRLYAPSLRHIDLEAPGYYFLASDTPALLRWLAVQARLAGAQLFFRQPFLGAHHEEDYLRLAGPPIRARYLIGADGARSAVAKAFGLGRNRKFLIGAELELPEGALAGPRRLHCFIDRRLAPGYIAWAVPGAGVTQVGLARRAGAAIDLPGLVTKLSGAGLLAKEAPVLARRAGVIPVGGLVAPLATHRVMLLGDAAGLVSPMTAGGITNAFYFGRRAAQVVADHLQDGGPEPSRVLVPELPKYRLKGLLRRAMDLAPPDVLAESLLATGPFRAFARAIYFRERGGHPSTPGHRYFRPRQDDQKQISALFS
jgi:flavin-dependent dehydrogenase